MTRAGRRALAVLCAFEDRAFDDVARPVIERVLAERYVEASPFSVTMTHGCRWDALGGIARDEQAWPDLFVVGADTRGQPSAKKRAAMKPHLARVLPERLRERCLLVLPRPCAEGWLQADLSALKRGLSEAIGEPVTLPKETGAYPRNERQAKHRLRELCEKAGVPTLRGGLEFGPFVVRHLDLAYEESLRAFVRDLRGWLEQRTIGA